MSHGMMNKKLGIVMVMGVLFTSIILTQTAFAMVERWSKNKTTCYVFKQDKLVKKTSCNFDATIGGSTIYGISNYDFTIKGYGEISTISTVNARFDANDEPINDTDGSLKDPIVVKKINEKPAMARYRHATSFKPMSQTQVNQAYKNQGDKGILSCMAAKDKSLEICVPLSKANLESA